MGKGSQLGKGEKDLREEKGEDLGGGGGGEGLRGEKVSQQGKGGKDLRGEKRDANKKAGL